MSKESSSGGGIGFCGLLTVAFVVLKLCKVIEWSWWWVLSPIWLPFAIGALAFLIYLPFKIRAEKDKHNRIASGYNEIGWKKGGKSKWQQRMEEMQKKK